MRRIDHRLIIVTHHHGNSDHGLGNVNRGWLAGHCAGAYRLINGYGLVVVVGCTVLVDDGMTKQHTKQESTD